MALRDVLNAHPQATKAALGLFVIVTVGAVAVQVFGNRRAITSKLPDVYFTDDDGKTFFSASSDNVPPWTHDGKTAVAAYVYRASGHEFVGFMARFTPETKKKVEQTKHVTATDEMSGRELKRPGEKEWVRASDLKRSSAIVDVKGPHGESDVEPVEPG